MVSREEAARLVLERKRAGETFEDYCRTVLKEAGQAPATHHVKLIAALDEVVAGTTDRLLVTMPPGAAKSTYGSVLLPGYFFMKRPGAMMIAASHTASLAELFSRRVMATIRDQTMVLGYRLKTEAAAGWLTTNGCEYLAAGVRGPIMGRRADLAVIDDPVKSAEEADSQTIRTKVWDWYWFDLLTRLKPGGRVVLIMTRWHEDDLAGRLLASECGWKVLRIPAEAEANDPIGRAPGQFLWDDQENFDYAGDLRRKKAAYAAAGQTQVWHALFQGAPRAPEGNIFKIGAITTIEARPAGFKWVRAWDLAATAKGGDYTVGALLGRGADGRFCIGDIVRLQGAPEEVERVLVATAARDRAELGALTISLPQDPGQAGKTQVAYLTRLLAGQHVTSSPETGDKTQRALPLASQVNAGNVSMLAAPWNRVLLDELGGFPAAKHDDSVDALSRAAATLIVPSTPVRLVPTSYMMR